jgi:hypothetical protein
MQVAEDRYAVAAPVRYRPQGSSSWNDGDTINLSRSGVLFYCEELLPVGATVQLYLAPKELIPNSPLITVCAGRVIRVVDHLADSRAAMAVQFV